MSKLKLTRRTVLRGMMAGGVVNVGLPILDCMLDTNGTAFAATGTSLPPCFATWFWGLGIGADEWAPKTAGTGYEMPRQFKALAPLQNKMNLFSGAEVFLDGASNTTHFTGVQGLMTGTVSGSAGDYHRSLDTIVGDVIGSGTRFRSIEVACDGDPKATWSAREIGGRQPAEVSPLALYQRIFGAEFRDPNAAEFTPDPQVLARKSALSAVAEQRQRLMKTVAASDRAKLDNYFTSLRALEQKLEVQSQKPQPLPSCTKPDQPPGDKPKSTMALDAMEIHDLFVGLLTHALACDQTRVVNMCITQGMSGLRREGDPTSHHTHTHEEAIDQTLGYQIKCEWFQNVYIKGLYTLAASLDSIHEGDRTLLDRMILFGYTDHGAARLHSVRNYPVITFGSANGRMKTGLHVPARGDAVTRVGFTVQRAMGVNVGSWGTKSNQVSTPYSQVLV